MLVPPACAGNVERVCRWLNGRRAQRAWHPSVGSCVCGPLPPACLHSTSRPTRPCTRPAESGQFWQVWGCHRSVPSRSLVPAQRRRVMGNSLGGHPYIVYRTDCLFAKVGGCLLAGDGCHQSVLYCRAVIAGLHLIRTRAAQFVYGVGGGDVARVSQRLARPARRRAIGHVGARPRGVGNVERVCRWLNGRRAQRAWQSSVMSCIVGPLPPACVHSTSRPTRPSSVTACGVGIRAILLVLGAASAAYGQLVGRPSQHRRPNGRLARECRWRLRGGRLVPSKNVVLPRRYRRAASY
jgi:hypothetical protein